MAEIPEQVWLVDSDDGSGEDSWAWSQVRCDGDIQFIRSDIVDERVAQVWDAAIKIVNDTLAGVTHDSMWYAGFDRAKSELLSKFKAARREDVGEK